MRVLITGGAGYFGETLCRKLLSGGHDVISFDLNEPSFTHPRLTVVQGDIRDYSAVRDAARGADIIHHNVAQVPLAKNKRLFWSVNLDGTRVMLEAARINGVQKIVYTSSSAVFGVPEVNPVTRSTVPFPMEDYGRAKLEGERLCEKYRAYGLDVSIIRPRTILGHGRLGVVEILFEWVRNNQPVPVFDGGHNVYQFVHADDLADACIEAGKRSGNALYNIGATEFGTMRELLEGLIVSVGSSSPIKSVPMRMAEIAMTSASALRISPLGPYHALMYGRTLYFDVTHAVEELGYEPKHSNLSAILDSYTWYSRNIDHLSEAGRSHHQSKVKRRAVALAPLALRLMPE